MIGLLAMVAAVGADQKCAARVGFYQPPRGVISTPRIATQVAQTYLNAIYGEDMIDRELPLTASVSREVWHIRGTLPSNRAGGVAEIDLCQSTGQVLRIVHGK